MNVNFHRILPVTAALALLLSACGSGDSATDGQPLDQPDSTADAGGLRAPTPIRTASGGSAAGGNQTGALASADAATSEMMIAPAYIVTDFVAGDGLGALPANTTGYVFDAGAMPSADDIARIAEALGVDGEPVLVDDGFSVYYQVGPNDGSAPTITLWDDAMLGWNYSSARLDEPMIRCAVAGSPGVDPETVDAVESSAESSASSSGVAEPVEIEPVDPDDEPGEIIREPIDCEEPEPPTGVPSADEAEATAISYLEAMGVDTSTLAVETWADEWSANVSANEQIDGVTARTWSFGFGGDAMLRYAHGSTATPQPVGPYDLIDLDTALERLNDGRYGYGSWGGGIAVLESDVAIGAPAIAEAPPEQGDVEMPGDEFPEPEEITVTLTDVGADLWWVWDVDGSAWLLPAYAFAGDDGGTYVVPAVTDEFLVEVEPPIDQPMPEPMPVEPDGGPGDGAEPLPAPDMYLPGFDDPTLDEWIGTTLDEFEAAVADFGWGPVRVAWADGEGYDLTEDYVIGRVNIAVETDGDGTQYVIGAAVELDHSDVEPPEVSEAAVAIVEVDEAVRYYPACGNETLEYGGTTWYPLPMWVGDEFGDQIVGLIEEASSVDREPYRFATRSGLVRVAPPGPGDDIGTLVIWADGFARWVSDNGNLDTWLTTTELQYPWEC